MKSFFKYIILGLLVASLEEFITQGVLKNNLIDWIVPTIVVFGSFLIFMHIYIKYLENNYAESKAFVMFYLGAGFFGLFIEWIFIGLNPWRDPNVLQIPFQLGMFGFWGSIALAPIILLDQKKTNINLRNLFKKTLLIGFSLIYFIVFTTSPDEKQFVITIIAVILFFLLLNVFYFKYFNNIRTEEFLSGLIIQEAEKTN
ncbi:MAG: hypothetical protein ACXAC7_20260 [Candidatus Hodarchaeales archaeon]|jgi:hypothetical protein